MRWFGLMALACAVVCAGCTGYRMGSPVPQALRTIHVPAFENRTEYPMVGSVAAQQLMDAIIEDGTFALMPYDRARLRVQAIVTGLASSAIRYERETSLSPEEYAITLKVQFYVFDRVTGETYINGKTFAVTESLLTGDDYQTSLINALPRLSRRLAQTLLATLHTLQPGTEEQPTLTLDEAAAALEVQTK